ncbi:helix-turn-helix domain-containing protein [Nocardia sp. R16R-3T]
MGTTPRRWLEAQRTVRARELLETTELPVEVVAAQSGFGSVTAPRVHLRAATGATPAGCRRSLRRWRISSINACSWWYRSPDVFGLPDLESAGALRSICPGRTS